VATLCVTAGEFMGKTTVTKAGAFRLLPFSGGSLPIGYNYLSLSRFLSGMMRL
jgi:hypothetical protein